MLTPQPTVVGDAALLISDENFNTRLENRLLDQFLVLYTVLRVGSDDKEIRISCESSTTLSMSCAKVGLPRMSSSVDGVG